LWCGFFPIRRARGAAPHRIDVDFARVVMELSAGAGVWIRRLHYPHDVLDEYRELTMHYAACTALWREKRAVQPLKNPRPRNACVRRSVRGSGGR
jgi:hypothetical protein